MHLALVFLDGRCTQCDLNNKNILSLFEKHFRAGGYTGDISPSTATDGSIRVKTNQHPRTFMQASAPNGGAHFADTVT
jgi:hypothetical protein